MCTVYSSKIVSKNSTLLLEYFFIKFNFYLRFFFKSTNRGILEICTGSYLPKIVVISPNLPYQRWGNFPKSYGDFPEFV